MVLIFIRLIEQKYDQWMNQNTYDTRLNTCANICNSERRALSESVALFIICHHVIMSSCHHVFLQLIITITIRMQIKRCDQIINTRKLQRLTWQRLNGKQSKPLPFKQQLMAYCSQKCLCRHSMFMDSLNSLCFWCAVDCRVRRNPKIIFNNRTIGSTETETGTDSIVNRTNY